MTDRQLAPFLYLGIAFHAALVAANISAVKIVALGPFVVPAGVLAYSVTFPLAEAVTEIWGRRRAQVVVNAGIMTQLLVWALLQVAIWAPAAGFWQGQPAYAATLGQGGRIILASLVAYLISQTVDLRIFARLRRLSGGRHLWLRNLAATASAQTLDTGLFIVLAFYGEFPVGPLILGQLVVKYAIALVEAPLVYALVYGTRRWLGADGQPEPQD
jgi:uncharacterized integral membrane protein (TIGR00697 family)